jgi:hypothetical protein
MLFGYSISGKWLELLKQIAPGVTRVAVLGDPTTPKASQARPPLFQVFGRRCEPQPRLISPRLRLLARSGGGKNAAIAASGVAS